MVGILGRLTRSEAYCRCPPLRLGIERTLRRSFDLLVAKAKDFGCVSFRLAAQLVGIVW